MRTQLNDKKREERERARIEEIVRVNKVDTKYEEVKKPSKENLFGLKLASREPYVPEGKKEKEALVKKLNILDEAKKQLS